MELYAHPFSSYSQKVLIALYANATPFVYRNLEDPEANDRSIDTVLECPLPDAQATSPGSSQPHCEEL